MSESISGFDGSPVEGETRLQSNGRFRRAVTRQKIRSIENRKAAAIKRVREAVAHAQALGADLSLAMPPQHLLTKQGSVKMAIRSLLTEDKGLLIGQQLLQGALDPTNPRQLDFISRLKEWVDGLETQRSERTEVQKRVVLNLGGVSPPAAPPVQHTLPDVVPPVGELPPPYPQNMPVSDEACQEGGIVKVANLLLGGELRAKKI